MGTNFYLVKKVPTVHETVHICKRSWGWKTSWQATDSYEWPRWCDDDPCTNERGEYIARHLPDSIKSVDDIVKYLKTGDWNLVDEYGHVYDDWQTELEELVQWDGGHHEGMEDYKPRDHAIECGNGYHDIYGNVFIENGFS